MRLRFPLLVAVPLAALAAVAVALATGGLVLPDRWNPLAPLAVAETPNLLTPYKLARASRDPDACRAALQSAGLGFVPVPDREDAPAGCGWRNAVRLDAAPSRLAPAVVLSCPAALSLALWERHVVQPLALRHFGHAVVRIEHLGSYACRNVDGAAQGRRSRHATADALDVAGFVLGNGQRVRVVSGWNDGDSNDDDGGDAVARFLREAHRGACPFFDGVLGPDYNAAHRDHFHLERGPHGVCR